MSEAEGDGELFARAAAAVAAGAEPAEMARTVVEALTPEERRWCLDGDVPFWAGVSDLAIGGYHRRPFPAARVARVGLPGFAFSDGPRGVVVGPATCFPVAMARGATWDPGLEERVGDAIGRELRAVGADLYGGVCVNLLRHPAWGRAQETYGEDPVHVGEMAAALTRGVQRHAMACVKHFACNSMENARFTVDVSVDDEALHEVFLPQFRRVVDEGVASVMSAYNSVNGAWCGENEPLLTGVLRDEWGFEGFVISDWIFGVRDAAASLRAGLDVEMPYRMRRAEALPDALAAGEVTEAEVDRAVTRVVATRLRFQAVLDAPPAGREVLACAEHRRLAREVAARSVVLLRNEPVGGRRLLPLAPDLSSLAVVGRLSAIRNLGDGGSSDVWAPDAVTVLAGMTAALPEAAVRYDDGSDPGRAATVAAGAEACLVVVGYTADDEGEFLGGDATAGLASLFPGPDDPELAAAFEAAVAATAPEAPPDAAHGEFGFAAGGDRRSLRLHPEDEELVEAVSAANPATVVALVAASAVICPWAASVPALLQCFYGGMEAGHGLADVLLGRVEPSGRLPFTVPAGEDQLPPFHRDATAVRYDRWHGWWRLERDGGRAAFPFGFGLGYRRLELGGWTVEPDPPGGLVVRGVATNPGEASAVEVVQVYGGPVDGFGPDRPARRLLGFMRVEVPPGGRAPVTVAVPATRLASRRGGRWQPGHGRWRLEVARHAEDRTGPVLEGEVAAAASAGAGQLDWGPAPPG